MIGGSILLDRKGVREFLDEELRETEILDDIFIGTENLLCTYMLNILKR